VTSTELINDYPAALRYLVELKSRGVSLGLDRMRRLADALGNPQAKIPCIHVAGTNGKGSVAAMLEAIFRAAGWRTGLYTSPHLVRLGERIQVDRGPLTETDMVGYVRELMPVIAELEARGPGARPSYFEYMTAMAMLHFLRAGCDIACIEVGLGGRLDATNIVVPEVSVITSIGLDHCEMLGDTFAAIAAEKAGIIKEGRPVVLGRVPTEAEVAIREIAARRNAQVISVVETLGDDLSAYPRTNLEGDYQRRNAATAMLVAKQFPSRWRLSDALIERALANVVWPARWQRFVVDGRHVILDTSHNAEGAGALDENLARLAAETGCAPIIVGGVLGTRRARALVEVFCRHAREIDFVVPAQSRACSFEQLESFVPRAYRGRVVRTSVDALFPGPGACAAGTADDVIVVTGSVYLAGEVLARLEPARGANEGGLQDF